MVRTTLTVRDKKPRSRPSRTPTEVNARATSASRVRRSGAYSKVEIAPSPPPPAAAVHDLRNVLHVISACAEAAARDVRPGTDTHENLADIRSAAARATKLLETLAVAPGMTESQQEPIDVDVVISDFLGILQRQAASRARVVFEPSGIRLRVVIDPHSLEHALLNLVVNAVDAIGRGGTITIRTENRDAFVRIGVSDTGAGMDAATLARAFDVRFTTRSAIGRRGMGLATVRRLIDTMGGNVSATSTPGSGTEVAIRLPAVLV
jgi:signal transduction histidine kinase